MNQTNRRNFLGVCSTLTGVCMINGPFLLDGIPAHAENVARENAKEIAEEIGKPLRAWREGEWDIHAIFTGVGESTFHIFPDGTTLLIDAGDRDTASYAENVVVLPDTSRRAGEWVARYIQRVTPTPGELDYGMLSHFHDDHGGGPLPQATKTTGRGKDYHLSGLAQVGEFFRFHTFFDRGYPDYTVPVPPKDYSVENIRAFLDWKVQQGEITREEFRVGALDQITLRRKPGKYDFHVRNLCRNGVVWQGEDQKPLDFFARWPKNLERWSENTLSLGMCMSYGPFRYYTGGDVSGRLVDDTGNEAALEAAVGRAAGKVDVCKANHHSYKDAMTPGFVEQVQARVYLINVWDQLHIQDNTMTNMASTELYPDERLICPTNFPPERATLYADRPWLSCVAKEGGHIVVRVAEGGHQYWIYFLTAEDESPVVRSVYGPFSARQ